MNGAERLVAAGLLAAVLAAPRAAAADTGTAATLRDAGSALVSGDHARAAQLAGPLTATPGVDRADRGEAWRIYGLALFHLGRHGEADAAILEHLRLEPDAHLDPAVFPPEVIVFFEDVRARHAAELAGRRAARPDTVRERLKNWFPPWGQFQNGHRTKGWIVGSAELLLAATAFTTMMVLREWCNEATGVCSSGGESRRDQAIRMRQLNLASSIAFAAVVAYAIIDAEVYYHRGRRAERSYISLGVDPAGSGGELVIGWSF